MAPKKLQSPFARLEALRDAVPVGPSAGASPASSGARPASSGGTPASPKGPARAVIRLERKGRGGKEVTVVDGLELSSAARQEWLTALKGALGCGGVLEGDVLVLQGDHRARLPALLTARGVRRVVGGG